MLISDVVHIVQPLTDTASGPAHKAITSLWTPPQTCLRGQDASDGVGRVHTTDDNTYGRYIPSLNDPPLDQAAIIADFDGH